MIIDGVGREFREGDTVKVIFSDNVADIKVGERYKVEDISFTIQEKHSPNCTQMHCYGTCLNPRESEAIPIIFLAEKNIWCFEDYFVEV